MSLKQVKWKKSPEIHIIPRHCESRGRVGMRSECDQCQTEDFTMFMFWSRTTKQLLCVHCDIVVEGESEVGSEEE